MMSDKPILFSPPMIRALLDGRKTQTRRIVKPQPSVSAGFVKMIANLPDCPYGQPVELLWVREACWIWGRWYINGLTKTGKTKLRFLPDEDDPRIVFDKPSWTAKRNGDLGWVYRHARFMPRWASRLTLRIKSVRIERVQDISDEDAIAEGAHHFPDLPVGTITTRPCRWSMESPRNTDGCLSRPYWAFANLWEKLYANSKDSWYVNPWVWVLEFEVIRQNIDEVKG